MQTLSVVIPSRTQPAQAAFLERALKSIHTQSVRSQLNIEIIVGIDEGALPPPVSDPHLRYVIAGGRSQVAALRAATCAMSGDLVAFLEDDDEWHPEYLNVVLSTLAQLPDVGFVSSTQLEIDDRDNVIRINDFPTPSGWCMRAGTWQRLGTFNADYLYHLDAEWLGRLGDSQVPRIHLVESTAPIDLSVMERVRPWLANVLKFGGGQVRVARHNFPLPLVRRHVHDGSGMTRIKRDAALKKRSLDEHASLERRFGRIPW